jgi:hypothetical protein
MDSLTRRQCASLRLTCKSFVIGGCCVRFENEPDYKAGLASQFRELMPRDPVRGRLPVAWTPVNKLYKLRLPADIIEDRALTGKQDESVNGFQLFRVEVDLNSIFQLHGKPGPFFFCADMLDDTGL